MKTANDALQSSGLMQTTEQFGAIVVFDQQAEGSAALTLPCPNTGKHRFQGRGVTRVCPAGVLDAKLEWAKTAGLGSGEDSDAGSDECRIEQCPAGPHTLCSATGTTGLQSRCSYSIWTVATVDSFC